jgi:hypothetical protein
MTKSVVILPLALCASIALIGMIGCNALFISSNSPLAPPGVGAAADVYHAFGDSITYGATLSDPATQAYPALVQAYEGIATDNFSKFARSGDQACDIPTQQIFPNSDDPATSPHHVSSVLIGTNDADVKGVGAYESVFLLCHQAAIAWLAIPASKKILASSSAVTAIGSGALDASNHWNAWVTEARGASVSFRITSTQIGPIYAWVRISDTSPATYSYALDGMMMGSAAAQTTPHIATQNGTSDSLSLLRLANVPAGTHTVTFTQTNNGSSGVGVLGIAVPSGTATGQMPTVLVGTVPYQLRGGTGPCSYNDAPCQQYIADIEADVNLFAGDGLDVRLFDTRKYMLGTTNEMADSLHPNSLGQIELSHAVESAW